MSQSKVEIRDWPWVAQTESWPKLGDPAMTMDTINCPNPGFKLLEGIVQTMVESEIKQVMAVMYIRHYFYFALFSITLSRLHIALHINQCYFVKSGNGSWLMHIRGQWMKWTKNWKASVLFFRPVSVYSLVLFGIWTLNEPRYRAAHCDSLKTLMGHWSRRQGWTLQL